MGNATRQERPKRLKARDVKEIASGRWDLIFDTLAPELELARRKAPLHVPNPKTGAGRDGFRLYKDWVDTGGGVLNTHDGDSERFATLQGSFTDGLALLRWLRPDWSFQELLDAIHRSLGGDLEPIELSPKEKERRRQAAENRRIEQEKRDIQRKTRLNRVWTETRALTEEEGTVGRLYLGNRGIQLQEWPTVTRVHRSLPYYDSEQEKITGHYPALVSLICQADGQPGSLHRVFLEPDGSGKAPVDAEKKIATYPSYLSISGGAIPLFPRREGDRTLHVGEGIETLLGVRQGIRETEPVWAAGTASLLAGFIPPPWAERLVIWGDLDLSIGGERAADLLAATMEERRIEVFTLIPGDQPPAGRKSYDWLDVLNDYGPDAIMDTYRSML